MKDLPKCVVLFVNFYNKINIYMQAFFEAKLHRTIATVVLALAGVALATYAYSNFEMTRAMYPMPMNISVNGEGEASAIPDVGQFSFSVMAEGQTAADAQSQSATKINDIMTLLKERGVEEKDIKTEGYNMYPKYKYEERMCAFGSWCPPGEQVQDGFEVSQTILVKVRDTAKAGELIAAVGEKGATNISGLTFTVDDESAVKTEARSKAIADARAKAEQIAADLGVEIVRVTSFYENEGYYGYGGGGDMMEAKAMNESMAPNTPVGENITKVNVSVSFEVREK
jgi:uncharacterized protein YggE